MASVSVIAGKRVLIVDDSPIVLQTTSEALEELGVAVTMAPELSALDTLKASDAFDLVLMDVQMPEAFGDDLAMVLRQVRGVEAPILLFSGLKADELATRVKDAELDGYISKRDDVDEIVAEICAWLDGTKKRDRGPHVA